VAQSRQEREAREARDRLKAYTARQQVHGMQKRRRVRDNVIAIIGVVVVAALATLTQVAFFTIGPGVPTPAPSESASAPAGTNVGAPDASLAEARTWTGTLTLNDIPLGIELDGALAPQAVAGWVKDVEAGYYTGKTCHRMGDTPGFQLLQCGSLNGDGLPDPSFSYGPIENAPADGVYPAGTIAMARAGNDAYSNGHQFFLVTGDTTLQADAVGGYTVVGKVTSGLDQLIAQIMSKGIDPATVGQDGTGQPAVPTVIRGVTLK
jgi:peptidyl-prolyl cis-trans isomerase B (cyclophilin B)